MPRANSASVMDFSEAAAVQRRLAEIEGDLAKRQNDWEKAARELAHTKRDYELKYALTYQKTSGTVKEREAETLARLHADAIWGEMRLAEGSYEGLKAVIRVLEARASIGQSILRAQGRA